MGLDVFYDGGRVVRLLIQGCLILWFGFFSSSVFSSTEFRAEKRSDGSYVYGSSPSQVANLALDCPGGDEGVISNTWEVTPDPTDYDNWQNHSQYKISCPWPAGEYFTLVEVKYAEECSEVWSHQEDPITGEKPSPNCTCETGWEDAGEGMSPRCVIDRDQEASECYENGQIYDAERGYCVLDCPEGQLDGVCLQAPSANDDSCNSESPDYQGFIGNGNTKHNICESDMECEGGSAGVVNGTMACIPDEYGPPSCPSDATVVIDEYGFVCATNNDAPEPDPDAPQEPNTDTNGDGEPDVYDPSNDPVSTDKAINDLKDSVDQGNENSELTNQRLDKIGEAIDKSNELQDESNGVLDDIRNNLEAPEGDFSKGDFDGLVPTFSESASGFKSAVSGHAAVQTVTSLTVGTNNSCPVYLLPATPISDPILMDVHCNILNDYRGIISAMFLFFWSGLALFTFMKA
jgi:hypothetical protein